MDEIDLQAALRRRAIAPARPAANSSPPIQTNLSGFIQ